MSNNRVNQPMKENIVYEEILNKSVTREMAFQLTSLNI